MEKYKLKLNNDTFELIIGKEETRYNNEGVYQIIDIKLNGNFIYSDTFGRYDLLDKILSEKYISFDDFFMGFATLIIDKENNTMKISLDGFEYHIIDGENYSIFLEWIIFGLKTKYMKRKDKLDKILKHEH